MVTKLEQIPANAAAPRWFRMREVAAILGVSQSQVYALAYAGEIAITRFGPRRVRVSAEAIRAYERRFAACAD